MKKTIKALALVAVTAIGLSTSGFAQEKSRDFRRHEKARHSVQLNDQQKAMMKRNQEERQAFHKSLEKTFSAKQRKIMADRNLKPMERRKALAESFSARQKRMIEKNKETVKNRRSEFVNSLSKDQKAAFERDGKKRQHRMRPDGRDRHDIRKKNS